MIKSFNRLEVLKRKKKYESLPDALKYIMLWSKWLIWDANKTNNRETLNEYWNMRNWMQHVLLLTYKLDDNIAPDVTEENYMRVWFELDAALNKEDLKSMKHIKYDMAFRYNGVTPIDLTAPKK